LTQALAPLAAEPVRTFVFFRLPCKMTAPGA
jgi:hypothetical protein